MISARESTTRAQHELTCFNAHYDSWCSLPAFGALAFNAEAEQHLITAILRHRNVHASRGAIRLLRCLVQNLRPAFPEAMPRVRLDGSFAPLATFDFLEAAWAEYLTAMASKAQQELCRHVASTAGTASELGTFRKGLIKLGTRISASMRRTVLHLPSPFP